MKPMVSITKPIVSGELSISMRVSSPYLTTLIIYEITVKVTPIKIKYIPKSFINLTNLDIR